VPLRFRITPPFPLHLYTGKSNTSEHPLGPPPRPPRERQYARHRRFSHPARHPHWPRHIHPPIALSLFHLRYTMPLSFAHSSTHFLSPLLTHLLITAHFLYNWCREPLTAFRHDRRRVNRVRTTPASQHQTQTSTITPSDFFSSHLSSAVLPHYSLRRVSEKLSLLSVVVFSSFSVPDRSTPHE